MHAIYVIYIVTSDGRKKRVASTPSIHHAEELMATIQDVRPTTRVVIRKEAAMLDPNDIEEAHPNADVHGDHT